MGILMVGLNSISEVQNFDHVFSLIFWSSKISLFYWNRLSSLYIDKLSKKILHDGFSILEYPFPSCSSLEITSEHFPWFKTNVVILCFDYFHPKSCYSFDGELTYIGESNYAHFCGGLTKYKTNLLNVGGYDNQKTEIMKIDANKNFSWSIVEPDFKFTRAKWIVDHSLVTVESSDFNEEYVLLIGGITGDNYRALNKVFKFNGTWFRFGKMKKKRTYHKSIYWNGAVYIIGRSADWSPLKTDKTKIEIWNIRDSPNHFKTTENWPNLFDWRLPHLFIVPDSFFPDN